MPKRKAKAKANLRPRVKAKKAGSGRAAAGATKAPAPKRPVPAASRPTAARASASGPGVRPLRDRVLVKRVEAAEGKVGSLYVPDSAREKPLEALVVAVGSGRTLKNGTRAALQPAAAACSPSSRLTFLGGRALWTTLLSSSTPVRRA